MHHLYLVCILFGMPSLHLFTFLMFFKSFYGGMKPANTGHIPFSLLDGTLPCVLVDTEPKVVKSCCKAGALAIRVLPMCQLFEKSGRGNTELGIRVLWKE